MIRHLLTIISIVWCTFGFAGYSILRVASLADAADDGTAQERRLAEGSLVITERIDRT